MAEVSVSLRPAVKLGEAPELWPQRPPPDPKMMEKLVHDLQSKLPARSFAFVDDRWKMEQLWKIFMAKSAMQMHARDAHRAEAKPHQCQQCLKSFSSNHQLVQHIRVHTGEKPYRCSYCDRRFKQLSHVQQHTRLHTGERPYRCHIPECGRAFIQLSNLQQHLRNHDAQLERAKNRPFQCAICGKGFATESSLRTHTAKQHAALIGGPNTTSCPVCHKLFLGPEALMEHMKQVHKEPGTSNMAGPNETSAAEGLSLTNPGSGSNAGSLQMSNQPNLLMHGHPGLQLPGQPGPGSTSGGLGQPSSGPAPAHLHNPHVQNSVPVPGTNPGPGSGSGNENWVIATPSVKRRAPTHACPVCGKHYVNEGSLRKHLAAHPETAHITSALRMWPCSICPAVFPHENGLLTHMEQMRMEPKHQFAAQYMLSRAAAERRFRDRGESPGPGNGSNSAQQGSTGAGTGGQDDGHMDDPSNVGSPAPASPGGSINQAGAGGQNMVQPRLTSPSTRSPAPSSAMTGPSHFVAPQPMMNIGMQGNEMEEDAAPLTPEEAAVARRIQQAGMEAVLRLAAASATTAGVGVGVPSGAGVSYQDTRLEQAIRLHQALGFPLPQPHPLHLHQQQLQFQQHQQHQSHHQQQLPQHQQPLHHGQQQQQQHQQSYNQQLQHHLSHQQPPQGH